MFNTLKKSLQDKIAALSAGTLFYVNIDRDVIWSTYLDAFKPEDRQGNNCNCCKSFLRQWGGIVAIQNNKVISIWDDIECGEEYKNSVKAISKYIHSLPVTDVFFNEFPKCGTNKNLDSKSNVTWEHFYVVLDKKFVKSNIDTLKGELRANKDVLKRSLDELTEDAVESTLELIASNSLYKGKEFESMLTEFNKLQKEYRKVALKDKNNFAWVKSQQVSQAVSRIRNTAIGTLLIDLSNGMDLDEAVTKYEKVVAPSNYKRPTSLVTPRMVQDAKDKLTELGLLDSIERRYSNYSDLSPENLLFIDKSSELKDIFDEIAGEQLVNPKTLSKVEELTIEDFIKNVIPTSKSIELLLENNHLGNFVSLIAPVHPDVPLLFKWDNPLSWSYTGGITDSMKERVKQAGGNVDGVLRFSIQWNEDGKTICDLDAHAIEPNHTYIYYSSSYRKDRGNGKTSMGGQLDVDMINPTNIGIENIYWQDESKMQEGNYVFSIDPYSGTNKGFKAQIEFNGQIYDFPYNRPFRNTIKVATVNYSKTKGFSITSHVKSTSNITSKQKWGISTNQFTKVKNIMLSPNYWNNSIGNKHYMFILEGCISDETPRPFFNEFLKPELDTNRKVMEIMASKLKIQHTDNQLSGVGFSETQRNSIYVRVQGKIKRTIKVNF